MKKPHTMRTNAATTFGEVEAFVMEHFQTNEGLICPGCGQFFKKYKKRCHTEMALFLIKLVKMWKRHMRYYTTRELFPKDHKATTEGVLLRHWGLIEVLEAHNTAGAPAGSYRPTEKGLQFVHGVISIPSHVHLVNNRGVGFSDKMITIKEALGTKFDYDVLMSGS